MKVTQNETSRTIRARRLGTVGGGVVEMLQKNRAQIEEKVRRSRPAGHGLR